MGCDYCKDIPFGLLDNKVSVMIPKHWTTTYKERFISVDVCMVKELHFLWTNGIRTIECCCGHGKSESYIAVDYDSITKMVKLGYKRITKKPDRYDLFLSKEWFK